MKTMTIDKIFKIKSKNLLYIQRKVHSFLMVQWETLTFRELSMLENFVSDKIFALWGSKMSSKLEDLFENLNEKFDI